MCFVFVFVVFLFLFWFRHSHQLKLMNNWICFAQLCVWQMLSCHPESVQKSLAKSWPWTCSCHSLHSLTLPPPSALFKTPPWNSSSASYTWAWQLFSDKLWSCVSHRGVLDSPIHYFFFFISIFMQLFVTLLGEISTEIPSSRTTLGHKVCKTKCDLVNKV